MIRDRASIDHKIFDPVGATAAGSGSTEAFRRPWLLPSNSRQPCSGLGRVSSARIQGRNSRKHAGSSGEEGGRLRE